MTIRKSIIMLGIVLAGMGAYAKSSVVQIKGSDTILNASQAIVEEYMKTNKKARIAYRRRIRSWNSFSYKQNS